MKTRLQSLLPILLLLLMAASPAHAAEIGANDVRVSFMGTDLDPTTDAKTPVSAFNPADNQMLLVWSGDQVDGHFQIWGQRIHASTGALAGGPFQISFSDSAQWDAVEPDVVFNPGGLEYLVVWSSDVLQDGAEEIHGQRLSRHGELVGTQGFRISDMGASDLDPSFDANQPAVAWNSVDGEYLVVWAGDDNDALHINNEFHIFGQRLAPDGTELGVNDELSAPVPDGAGFDFVDPELDYNPAANQYLLVFEAYVPGVPGAEIGGDVLGADAISLTPGSRFISTMGASTSDDFNALNPVVHYNAVVGQYLVAWDGDHLTNEEFEVYTRWINPADATVAGAQVRMSDMGVDGSTASAGIHPSLAYDSNNHSYLVAWQGDDDTAATPNMEPEIFGQQFDPMLVEFGTNDFRLSDMGPDPTSPHEAASATAQFNATNNLFLIAWSGDDDAGGMAVGEEEIHLQRWGSSPTGVEDEPGPRRFALHANVPNPFNPSTTIYYDVPVGSPMVTLRIYDAAGRLVRTLVRGKLPAGRRSVQWQGRDDAGHSVASGVYHLRMEAGEFKSSRKLALVQ